MLAFITKNMFFGRFYNKKPPISAFLWGSKPKVSRAESDEDFAPSIERFMRLGAESVARGRVKAGKGRLTHTLGFQVYLFSA